MSGSLVPHMATHTLQVPVEQKVYRSGVGKYIQPKKGGGKRAQSPDTQPEACKKPKLLAGTGGFGNFSSW